jgi:hydrogenase maturation protein HypF
MLPDIETVRDICHLDDQEQSLLESSARPIVLLSKRQSIANEICEAVAPENHFLGVMLPYTPLHHLIMDAMQGEALVMTSGNRSDEPIAYRDDDAIECLAGIADVFLGHNRPIHVRCDDSIVKRNGDTQFVRRSRGYAPHPVKLPFACDRPLLAVGGQLKNVFALAHEGRTYLSHHLGDLDHFQAYQQFERDIRHYEELLRITPQAIVHDLHPDNASTQYAIRRAQEDEIPRLAVQHHHAHMASCMADNELIEPVIAIAFDGTGYGIDEQTGKPTVWGGEILVGNYQQFRRVAHLRDVYLPGGEKAVREPWRMAAAYLFDAGCDLESWRHRIDPKSQRAVQTMLERRFNTPQTSSAGRLFDAVASLVGIRDCSSYEGQAAMELEWLAANTATDPAYPFDFLEPADSQKLPAIIDTRPFIRAVVDDCRAGLEAATISRRFHSTLVSICTSACRHARKQTRLNTVVLSGGVFLNTVLSEETAASLTEDGFEVYRHRQVPTNDGGLSLGQVAVAASLLGV